MANGEGDAEEQERSAPGTAVDAKKRKRSAAGTDDGAGLCDDVVGNILARLPARAALASMTLSKRHRRLIRSPEFQGLCQLSPPLPRPHIAYLATAPIKRRPKQKEPSSVFLGFHVAGAGVSGTTAMHSLDGLRYLDLKYVNTCNGVVLLASEAYSAPCRCVLWNPAVADVVEEVTVPDPNQLAIEYLILGLGYGQRSKTYKLLLMCRKKGGSINGGTRYWFASFPLGGDEKEPTELPSAGWDGEGSQVDSLYIDGEIYLLRKRNSAIFAFDVNDERVISIDVPFEDVDGNRKPCNVSKLMEMSGRPCLVSYPYHSRDCTFTLWVLSRDHRWGQRFLIREPRQQECPTGHMFLSAIKGVWDCGGVLVLYLQGIDNDIFLYNVMMEKMFKAKMDQYLTPPPHFLGFSYYTLCWGYRPTLVSPSSIVGKLNRDKDEQSRECPRDIMKALKPIVEQDRRKGQEATLRTVFFMDLLVCIMQKLPKELQQVLEMTMIDDLDFSFHNVPLA